MTIANPSLPSGGLRDALIDAGIRLLEDEGPDGLTLRRIAARAGVSHAAPAHHFAGLSGLLTAMAARAYDLFTAHIDRGGDHADPFEAVAAICDGYLDFARAHAGLFHLLFVETALDPKDADLRAAGDRAYGVLRAGCLPFSTTGQPDPDIELTVWSLVHGYALLHLETACLPGGFRPGTETFRRLLASALGADHARD